MRSVYIYRMKEEKTIFKPLAVRTERSKVRTKKNRSDISTYRLSKRR